MKRLLIFIFNKIPLGKFAPIVFGWIIGSKGGKQ